MVGLLRELGGWLVANITGYRLVQRDEAQFVAGNWRYHKAWYIERKR